MDNDLRERLSLAFEQSDMEPEAFYYVSVTTLADIALAALGLDDLDALTKRTLAEFADGGHPLYLLDPKHIVWAVLNAAFTPTPESEVSDG